MQMQNMYRIWWYQHSFSFIERNHNQTALMEIQDCHMKFNDYQAKEISFSVCACAILIFYFIAAAAVAGSKKWIRDFRISCIELMRMTKPYQAMSVDWCCIGIVAIATSYLLLSNMEIHWMNKCATIYVSISFLLSLSLFLPFYPPSASSLSFCFIRLLALYSYSICCVLALY